MNKYFLTKPYTFPSGVVIDCFVVKFYMHTFETSDITFRIEGYKDVASFRSGSKPVEMPMTTNLQYTVDINKLDVTLSGDEERLLDYIINNSSDKQGQSLAMFNGGIKTLI